MVSVQMCHGVNILEPETTEMKKNEPLKQRGGKNCQPGFGRGLASSRQTQMYSLEILYNVPTMIENKTQ